MIDTRQEALKTKVEEQYEEIEFYYAETDKNGNVSRIVINNLKFINLLKDLGFRRLDIDKNSFIVRIIDNIVEEVEQRNIIDVFEDHILKQDEYLPGDISQEMLLNKLYKVQDSLFSKIMLYRLRSKGRIGFNEDTQHESFLYFSNGYARVTKQNVELMEYKNLNGSVWKSQILPRKFKPLDVEEFTDFSFYKFLSNIADNYLNEAGEPNNPLRFEALKSIIGYNLHRYYEGKLRATVLTDARTGDGDEGRSGKTLLCKAIGHMLNASKYAKSFVELNGKDFDTTDRFKYQECALETRLIHLNDVRAYFKFETMFNDISEGIKVQRKNETPFLVVLKIIFSTNKTIKIHGASAADRAIEFELADYYSDKRSPAQEFNEWFFRDWNAEQWNKFDNIMIHCLQMYLRYGIIKVESINLEARKLKEETCQPFITFMEELGIQEGIEYGKKALYNDFREKNTDYEKLKQHKFTKWVKLYAKFTPDIKQVDEVRRNSTDFIVFSLIKNEELTTEITDR